MARDESALGAALHGQIAARASPVEGIAAESREIDEGGGTLVRKAKATIEEAGTEADGDGQAIGVLAEGLAGVVRCDLRRIGARQGLPFGERHDARLPSLQQLDQLCLCCAGLQVERPELQVLLAGGGDAALMYARRIDHGSWVEGRGGGCQRAVDQRGRLCEQRCRAAGDGGRDQVAAGDMRKFHGRLQVG